MPATDTLNGLQEVLAKIPCERAVLLRVYESPLNNEQWFYVESVVLSGRGT